MYFGGSALFTRGKSAVASALFTLGKIRAGASDDIGDNRTRRALTGSERAPQQVFLAHEARR